MLTKTSLQNVDIEVSQRTSVYLIHVEASSAFVFSSTKTTLFILSRPCCILCISKGYDVTNLKSMLFKTQVAETVDEQAKPNEDIISGQIGTHFVTGVTYGAEIVASFKFKASASASLSKYVWPR